VRKRNPRRNDDLRPEYDFSTLKGGVRGKYLHRYRSGTNLVLLEPELARAFPSDAAVNEALRAVLRASKLVRRSRRPLGKQRSSKAEPRS
jgi:hypothetical protein